MLKVILTMLVLAIPGVPFETEQEPGPAMLEMLAGWKSRLNLSEDQEVAIKALGAEFEVKGGALADQFEAEGGEVDKKAAVGALKQFRGEFLAGLENILDDGQKGELESIQQEIHQLVLRVIGTKRAQKLQKQVELTDEQVQNAVPVLARQTGELEAYFEQMQQGGGEPPRNQRRARRAKVKQARGLKEIADEANDQLKEIMTDEQWQKYEAIKEQQREQMKAKARNSKG